MRAEDQEIGVGVAAVSDEWMKYLPAELQESFAKAQVRSRINSLDDDTPLTQDLASVYLDISDATLKRMRASGKGPKYVQSISEEGTKSRNQKVLYTVGALKEWIEQNRTNSTGHAAVRRGLMFGAITDLLIPEPWINLDGLIAGHALSIEIAIDEAHIEWMSVLEAIKRRWKSRERDIYSSLAKAVLLKEIENIKAIDEAECIERMMSE